jgi:DNA polymerase III alpha subunit (gram-positive type)
MSKTNKSKHYVVLDFETGGVDNQINPICEVGLAVYDNEFNRLETYESVIAPYHHDFKDTAFDKVSKFALSNNPNDTLKKTIEKYKTPKSLIYEDKALEVNGLTMDRILDDGKTINTVASEIRDILKRYTPSAYKKPIFVAHNASFDWGFLFHFEKYARIDIESMFHRNYMCTLNLSEMAFPGNNKHTLSVMCDQLDIELESAHSALPDVLATGELLEALLKKMRGEEDGYVEAKVEKIKKEFQL